MAYRVECNKTTEEFFKNLENFLTNPVSFDDVDYSEANGDGAFENITFNYDNAKTEQWQFTYDTSGDDPVFKVKGTESGDQDDASVDERYDNGIIAVTIRNGDHDWHDGDKVTIDVIKSSNPPFELVNSGLYNYDNKVEIEGDYGFGLSMSQRRNSLYKGIRSDDNNFLGCFVSNYWHKYSYGHHYEYFQWDSNSHRVYCPDIGSNHKVDGDFTLIWSKYTDYYHTIYDATLNDFASDNIDKTTKYIQLNITPDKRELVIVGTAYDVSDVLDDYIDNAKGGLVYFGLTIKNNGDWAFFINSNKEKTGSCDDWSGASFYLRELEVHHTTAFHYWKSILTDSEIADIHNNLGQPLPDGTNPYVSLINNKASSPYLLVKNSRFGYYLITNKFIKYMPTLNIAKFEEGFVFYSAQSNNVSEPLRFTYNSDFDSIYSYHTIYWDLGKMKTKVKKYWIIQNGETLLMSAKLFDTAKNDNPVYQIFYIGYNDGDIAYDLPMSIGMFDDQKNWWDTSASDYRFGLFYNNNMSAFMFNRWSYYFYNYGYRSYSGTNYYLSAGLSSDWKSIKNNSNKISIIPVNIYNSNINYGKPKWIYAINYKDITAESEIYIDDVKYVVIPDNQDVTDIKYLIKLEE